MPPRRHRAWIILSLGLLLLAACASQPGRQPPAAWQAAARQAAGLARQGDLPGALARYRQALAQAPAPKRPGLTLAMAAVALQANQPDQATRLLAGIPAGQLSPDQQWRLALLQARLALRRHRAEKALEWLARLPEDMPMPLLRQCHQLRARAYDIAANYVESARERIWLDPLLDTPAARHRNHLAIWQALTQLSNAALETLAEATSEQQLRGWLELVVSVRRNRQFPVRLQQALADWRQRHPDHPATEDLLGELITRAATPPGRPHQIAVLLPLSGRLAAAGQAIQDGILVAYYDTAEASRPILRFYDTAVQDNALWALYNRAVSDGAEMVIGPLTKHRLKMLAQTGSLPVPVLGLNDLADLQNRPDGLYQFGLDPEDEIDQLADRAIAEGHQRAVMLAPAGAWGSRLVARFRARWEALGGRLLQAEQFGRQTRGYSAIVARLLHTDQSRARHRRLSRLLGTDLAFEPRRRQDIDVIVLVARPTQARLLRPLVRFHQAGDLPLYGISVAYQGVPDPERDGDMDGLRFCDMPWLLQPDARGQRLHQAIGRLWPLLAQDRPRLFALGIDAYGVLPFLQELGQDAFGRFSGQTGTLSLDEDGRLHRELLWAEFHQGVPRLLPPIDVSAVTGEQPGWPAATDAGKPTMDQGVVDEQSEGTTGPQDPGTGR